MCGYSFNCRNTQTSCAITCGISTGVMGFKYKVRDAQGNYTNITSTTGQSEPMKAAVYLQTSDIPDDPLVLITKRKLDMASNDALWRSAA